MNNLLKPEFDAIPQFLRDLPYWAAWPAIPRDNGKISKPPLGINGAFSQADKPDTWASYDPVKMFYEEKKGQLFNFGGRSGPISGVGILLQSSLSLVGIDFDSVIDLEGNFAEWARPFIQALEAITYCELSPSGKGIRAFIQGKKPDGRCRRGDLEIYDNARFLTVTGHKLPNCPNEAGNGAEAQTLIYELADYINRKEIQISTGGRVLELHRSQSQANALSDSELIARARQARDGKYFSALFDSGHIPNNDASGADQALCNKLAFWTGRDAEWMDRLMRQSALLKSEDRLAKWDKVHSSQGLTYGQMTIAKAVQDCEKTYDPNRNKQDKEKPSREKLNRQANDKQDSLPMAEDDLAVRFVAKYKNSMRYCHTEECWYGWNGELWKRETMKQSLALVRKICKDAAELAGIKERKGLLRKHLYNNVEGIAQIDEAVRVTHEIWDANIYLLGTPHGTVDLKTGKINQANPNDYITKSTSIAPTDGTPQRWMQFLDETTAGDKELQRFLQQICGMVLTGDTSEHILIFVYGPGGNGKSVFLTVITEILADYAANAPMETFIITNTDRHPTELAMLRGARLVTASETEEGRNWAESKIKQLTGGDQITARFMRQDFFQYKPQFKLIIIGNHKPSIRTLDDAIKRRINIIPFTQKPPKVDAHLNEKLRAEYPQILSWMIQGCLDWQKNGLQRPESVKRATEDYFADQDMLSQWIAECCNVDPMFSGKSSALFTSWKEFAERNGIKAGNAKIFKASMEWRGYENKPQKRGNFYLGICLKPKDDESKRYPD